MHSLLQVKLQATGHNRALQRNKISCVLEDFCAVQEEADRLDTNLVANLQVSESMFSRILEQEDSKKVEKTLAASRGRGRGTGRPELQGAGGGHQEEIPGSSEQLLDREPWRVSPLTPHST